MGSTQHSGHGRSARTIEQIVRAELLLLVPILCAVAALLIERRGVIGWAALVCVSVALAAIARAFAGIPGRELLALGQRALLAGALAVFVAVGLLPQLGWYRPVTVLSGSMRPTFSPGDLIFVRPEPLRDVRVGQVISYQVPVGIHQVETHRVIRIVRGGPSPVVQTQGDANNWHDPWTAKLQGKTAWHLRLVVPYGGHLISSLRSRTMHVAAIVVAPALLALLVLAELWGVPGLAARLRQGYHGACP